MSSLKIKKICAGKYDVVKLYVTVEKQPEGDWAVVDFDGNIETRKPTMKECIANLEAWM